MNRVYRWLAVGVLVLPFVVDVWRIGNRWFDAWFIAQLRKTWATVDTTLLMR